MDGILFDRCFGGEKEGVSLHVFCDASKVAMGVCIFSRYEENGEVVLKLVTAKARVAPLGEMTIPRKELVAALLASRLGAIVVRETGIEDITYWSDSMVTLNWIKKGEWRAFVRICVNEILQISDAKKWCFVPGGWRN